MKYKQLSDVIEGDVIAFTACTTGISEDVHLLPRTVVKITKQDSGLQNFCMWDENMHRIMVSVEHPHDVTVEYHGHIQLESIVDPFKIKEKAGCLVDFLKMAQ